MKYRYFVLTFAILFAISSFYCSSKNDDKSSSENKKSGNELVRKSGDNIFVTLKMIPKIGEVHNYKMLISQSASQVSDYTNNKEISSRQDIEYYYSLNASEINSDGVITYKVKYDSIKVYYSENNPDNPFEFRYNSNIKDSIYKMQDFATYNAIIGNEFKIRVSPLSEVKEVIEMDKIESVIEKEFGDTLKTTEKNQIMDALKNQMKEVIQSQFQKFKDKELSKDSTWTFTEESTIGNFPVQNIMTYKITDIQQQDKITKVTISSNLDFKVLENVLKDMQATMSLEDENGTGSGTIIFNVSSGIVEKKTYDKSFSSKIKLSGGGKSIKMTRKDSINFNIELLK